MTVVLALMCSDGVVIAADTQITDEGLGMSYPAQKLHTLGTHAAWGGSGARAVLVDLERELSSSAGPILRADDIGHALQERVMPVLQHHYEHYIPNIPGSESKTTPATYVLAAGFTDEEPWILEVNPNAMVSHFEDVGFHAIGSGAPMAQQAGALLAHFRMTERSVNYGMVTAVRVLDALSRTSPNIGGPLDVCRITPDGAHMLDDTEQKEVRDQVDRWTELEQRTLDDLFEEEE